MGEFVGAGHCLEAHIAPGNIAGDLPVGRFMTIRCAIRRKAAVAKVMPVSLKTITALAARRGKLRGPHTGTFWR